MQRRSIVAASIALMAGTACSSDDDGKLFSQDDASVTVDDERVNPSVDSGTNIDAAAVGLDIDGAVTLPDGAVIVSRPDASVADGAASLDGSSSTLDGALVTGPDGGACDIVHPVYGCGDLVPQGGWVTFPDGLEVDLVNNVAWTTPVAVEDDDELASICASKTTGGFKWELPQMKHVRLMADGCPKTMPGGSCLVENDEVVSGDAGDCDCEDGLRGPNNGKFCRPEVPLCETIWVWTHSEETGTYEHWFYDVDSGDLVRSQVGVDSAVRAKGRCVHALTASEMILR